MISLPAASMHHLLKHLLSHSLVGRLHEAFRQCQDLRTEKAQMDRKINQLSEENGDLSFKVRGAVSFPCPHSPAGCDGARREDLMAVLDAGMFMVLLMQSLTQ